MYLEGSSILLFEVIRVEMQIEGPARALALTRRSGVLSTCCRAGGTAVSPPTPAYDLVETAVWQDPVLIVPRMYGRPSQSFSCLRVQP